MLFFLLLSPCLSVLQSMIMISFPYFREFIACCGKALEINDQLIKEDQRMYQEDLKEKYVQLKTKLAKYIGDEVRYLVVIN